jgi:hypothetical protein
MVLFQYLLPVPRIQPGPALMALSSSGRAVQTGAVHADALPALSKAMTLKQ